MDLNSYDYYGELNSFYFDTKKEFNKYFKDYDNKKGMILWRQ